MPDETAMLLTQQEWEDLSTMVDHYANLTEWVEGEPEDTPSKHVQSLRRQRALAQRIVDATRL